MATPARDPFIAYLLVLATRLRRSHVAPAVAALLAEHVNALELLADVVRDLPQDDERLLLLVTLAVRHGQFAPGRAADHALTQFAGASRAVCDTFLTTLVQVARDDALGQRAVWLVVAPMQRPRTTPPRPGARDRER
jgi:hypothetical protein